MLKRYEADLHIHTLLSPCGEIEMIPSLIVAAAGLAGLDIIGIADHNSCGNAAAVIEAARDSSVKVLPGLEVQSVEGVHLLCLFDTIEQAEALQEAVYASLPNVPGAKFTFDEQMIVDANDEFVGYCERPISLPTNMDIDEVYERAVSAGGMVIPSHIDRFETGICGVLGMLPEYPVFEAVEISANISADEAYSRYLIGKHCEIMHNADAHWLAAVGSRRTIFHMEHRTIEEIRKACKSEDGRRVGDA